MSFISAICFFAFVATAASKIIVVDLADWECVSNRLNATAGRSPKLATLYSELNEIYRGIVSEAEKCNRIKDGALEFLCQGEWEAHMEDLSRKFLARVHQKVSLVEMAF